MNVFQIIKTLTHVLLTIVIMLFIVTGFGITNYQIDRITYARWSVETYILSDPFKSHHPSHRPAHRTYWFYHRKKTLEKVNSPEP